jgi:lipid II:glycine glycyltransferase (peptidoglycan interpeptide bridge formation enzyme)
MGKAIKKNQIEIFGKELDWVRERNFGNGGPTDFAFILKKDKEEEELVAAFEVKLRSTIQAYKADVEKLQRLEPDKKKYFIALVDTFEKDQFNDLRIKTLEKDFPTLKRIASFKNFPTNQDWYSTPVCCLVCVWEVQ